MGYFANQAIDAISWDDDRSYPDHEKQLLWRLEDLQDRLEELAEKRTQYEDAVTFSEADLRYALPKHLYTVADVQAAMELAICDLEDRYGIRVREEEETPVMDEITGMQISFMDILAMQTLGAA